MEDVFEIIGKAGLMPVIVVDRVEDAVPLAEAGAYGISVRIRQAADGGRFQAAVADSAAGPWTALGPEQDAYAAADAFATLNLSDAHTFGSAGPKLFRFTVTGQAPASAGRALYLDSIRLTPSP